MAKMKDCHVCHGPHDEEFHAAVRRVREWWKANELESKAVDLSPKPKPESSKQWGAALTKEVTNGK